MGALYVGQGHNLTAAASDVIIISEAAAILYSVLVYACAHVPCNVVT